MEEKYERRRRRLDLVIPATHWPQDISNTRARQHLKEGFNRRIYMIDSSIEYLLDNEEKHGEEPMSPHEATGSAVQLNALYLNICGALDNLAWAIQYEWSILSGITETEGQITRVSIAKERFLKALHIKYPELSDSLRKDIEWNRDLRGLRDPAAHKIPLYVAPGIMDQNDYTKYLAVQAEAQKAFDDGDYERGVELQYNSTRIGRYESLMILSHEAGLEPRRIPTQVCQDNDRFVATAEEILRAIFPTRWPWGFRRLR